MRVKICGITRLEDALAAGEEGADALGFIFVPGSPRYIEPGLAGAIVRELPPFLTPVGVFADALRPVIARTIAATGIRCLQLHGNESPSDCEGYDLPVIKAVRVGAGFDAAVMRDFKSAAYLLDTYNDGSRGGTGQTFDWRIAVQAKEAGPLILAGGITPENVADAIRTVHPYAIDLSSGVESAPGVKDREKIRRLFENIRAAS